MTRCFQNWLDENEHGKLVVIKISLILMCLLLVLIPGLPTSGSWVTFRFKITNGKHPKGARRVEPKNKTVSPWTICYNLKYVNGDTPRTNTPRHGPLKHSTRMSRSLDRGASLESPWRSERTQRKNRERSNSLEPDKRYLNLRDEIEYQDDAQITDDRLEKSKTETDAELLENRRKDHINLPFTNVLNNRELKITNVTVTEVLNKREQNRTQETLTEVVDYRGEQRTNGTVNEVSEYIHEERTLETDREMLDEIDGKRINGKDTEDSEDIADEKDVEVIEEREKEGREHRKRNRRRRFTNSHVGMFRNDTLHSENETNHPDNGGPRDILRLSASSTLPRITSSPVHIQSRHTAHINEQLKISQTSKNRSSLLLLSSSSSASISASSSSSPSPTSTRRKVKQTSHSLTSIPSPPFQSETPSPPSSPPSPQALSTQTSPSSPSPSPRPSPPRSPQTSPSPSPQTSTLSSSIPSQQISPSPPPPSQSSRGQQMSRHSLSKKAVLGHMVQANTSAVTDPLSDDMDLRNVCDDLEQVPYVWVVLMRIQLVGSWICFFIAVTWICLNTHTFQLVYPVDMAATFVGTLLEIGFAVIWLWIIVREFNRTSIPAPSPEYKQTNVSAPSMQYGWTSVSFLIGVNVATATTLLLFVLYKATLDKEFESTQDDPSLTTTSSPYGSPIWSASTSEVTTSASDNTLTEVTESRTPTLSIYSATSTNASSTDNVRDSGKKKVKFSNQPDTIYVFAKKESQPFPNANRRYSTV